LSAGTTIWSGQPAETRAERVPEEPNRHVHFPLLLSNPRIRIPSFCDTAQPGRYHLWNERALQPETMIHTRRMRLVGHVASKGLMRIGYAACQESSNYHSFRLSGVTIGRLLQSRCRETFLRQCLKKVNTVPSVYLTIRPPLWSSGQSSWLQIRRPGFDSRHYQIFWRKKSNGSGTGSTQPREYN
jgi:hypothetical protein